MTFTPARMLHLFVIVALLFSQWVSAQHMLSHLDDAGPAARGFHSFATASVEQASPASRFLHHEVGDKPASGKLHAGGKAHTHNDAFAVLAAMATGEQDAGRDAYCAIYHAFSSSCLIAEYGHYLPAIAAREPQNAPLSTPAAATAEACCHLIRGPPVLS